MRSAGEPSEKIETLPSEPGVYLFLNRAGQVIYVGKAKDLRRRVRSYFRPSGKGDGRLFFPNIVQETRDLEFIVTANEKEALILENVLIKEHRPAYNLVFRDDKSYLSVRLAVGEAFPRLHVVRKVRKDGALYFGPFSSSHALRETLRAVKTRFPLRTCSDAQFANRSRPCLRHEIGHCRAPCCGRIDEAGYAEIVREAVWFLEGRFPELADALRERMRRASERLHFEEAARLRDLALAVEQTLEKQTVISHRLDDHDVFGLYREGPDLGLAVLKVREGRVVGSTSQAHLHIPSDAQALSAALMQFYDASRPPPPSVLVPLRLPDAPALEEILAELRGGRVRIRRPARGPGRALLAMAGRNAAHALSGSDRAVQRRAAALADLGRILGLPAPPRRLECLDASHIAGSHAVGALAVFVDGLPEPRRTRTYRIRRAAGGDDFASMRELVARRFAPDKEAAPDLLVVDGGPPQLAAALDGLDEAGRADVPVVAIAKERGAGGERTPDRIHVPGREGPLPLASDAPALFLLGALRDEAHRLAVKYHRKLRSARTLRTGLEEIVGVGPKRRAALLRAFGSLEALRAASLEAVAAVPGISPLLAQRILEVLADGGGGEV